MATDRSTAAARPTPAPAVLPPLKGGMLALGTVALALATFMNVLDTSIANVSIPAISGDLGVSPNQGTWVITSFGVANAISLPLTGWLTQRYGQVKLFLVSIVLFVIASIACGWAPSIEALIVFRVIQGAVAGPMIPLSQSLLLSSYPKEKAGTALSMWSITTLVAPVAGPLLGAAIAIGCAVILRGRGGDPTSHAARVRRAYPGRLQHAAKLSKDIDNGKVVPPGS